MIKTKKVMLLAFVIMISMMSCNSEELFVEPEVEEVINYEDEEEVVEEEVEEEAEEPEVDPSLPCDFNLNALEPNSTIIINCMMDLQGQTINLPANVTIVYEGGDIINGTLNFTDDGIISGELLNSSLTLGGSTPQLKDTTFNFDTQRWDIIEGPVDDEMARTNRDLLEGYFEHIKSMGATTFSIDRLDAYFKVDGYLNTGVPETLAINIPSDFHLSMTENTHLRMQPNGHFRAVLLAVYNQSNITVTGGVLHGEREEHDYNSGFVDSDGSTGPSNEWLSTMGIKGGQNITVDGVTFMDGAGDGLFVDSIYHYFDSRHIRSKNIQILNNTFMRARRINLTLVDCEQVYIENNEFIDGGIDMTNSNGTAPSCDFNMEPVREWHNGEFIEYQRVSDVYIRNNHQMLTNYESNPKAGGFYFSHGNNPIILENNEISSIVSFTTVEGLIIRNNILGSIGAGSAANTNRVDMVYGNEIYENTINGGVYVAGNGVTVRDNDIDAKVGVKLGAGATSTSLGVSNCIIKNNNIIAKEYGINSINTTSNTIIEGNDIHMLQGGGSFALFLTNQWSSDNDANFQVINNHVTGTLDSDSGAPASVISAKSILLTDNSFGSVQIAGGKNIIFKNNGIDAEINKDGLIFNGNCPNSTFTDNSITVYESKTPLRLSHIKIKDGLQLSNDVLIDNNTFISK